MTKLGFQLGEALGTPNTVLADSTVNAIRGLVGSFAVGDSAVGGLSAIFQGLQLVKADSINFLSDSVSTFIESFEQKTIVKADSLRWGENFVFDSVVVRLNLPPEVLKTFSDQLFLYDIFNLQLDGADALIQFADAISIFYLQDSVNLQLSYLLQQSEELQQLSEELQVASPIAVYAYDTLMYNWDDSVATGFIMVLQVADTIDSLQDAIQAVISTTVLPVSASDQLQALSDSVTKLRLSYEKFVEDQIIVLSDTYAGQMHHFLRKAEQLEALLERIVLDSGGTSFADGLTLSDGVTVQLAGFSTGEFSDALSLSDAVSVALGPVTLTLTLSDSINNLADANTRSLATPLLTLSVADSINNLADSITSNQLAFGTNVVSRIRRYLGDMQG